MTQRDWRIDATLTPREEEVLALLGEGKTQVAIAKMYDVSPSRIRQIKIKAEKKLYRLIYQKRMEEEKRNEEKRYCAVASDTSRGWKPQQTEVERDPTQGMTDGQWQEYMVGENDYDGE